MSDQNLNDIENKIGLGSNQKHEILVDFTDSFGENFKGKIVVKRPNMGDYLKIGAIKARYLKQAVDVDPVTKQPIYADPAYIDGDIKTVAQIIATFKVVVTKAPSWFSDPQKINDFRLLDIVYTEYEVWLNSFRRSDKDEPEGDSEKSTTKDAVLDS